MEFDTGEGQRIRVVVMTKGTEVPVGDSRSCPTARCSSPSAPASCASSATACSIRKPVAGGPTATSPASPACPAPCTATWTSRSIRSSPRTSFVYLSYTKPLDEKRRTVAIARGTLRRQGAHRGQGHLRPRRGRHDAHRVRQRRHALRHDDRRQSERSELPAEPRRPGRQGAAHPRRWQHPARQPVRGKAGRQARGLYARPSQRARTRRCIPAPARCGSTRTARTAATRSTS